MRPLSRSLVCFFRCSAQRHFSHSCGCLLLMMTVGCDTIHKIIIWKISNRFSLSSSVSASDIISRVGAAELILAQVRGSQLSLGPSIMDYCIFYRAYLFPSPSSQTSLPKGVQIYSLHCRSNSALFLLLGGLALPYPRSYIHSTLAFCIVSPSWNL
jgi:hypothetical protein